MQYDLKRLAQEVKNRRKALGLTQRELANQVGVNPERISTIERADLSTNLRWNSKGWVSLEAGLGWAHGSAKRVAEGGEPVLVADTNSGTHYVEGQAQAVVTGPRAAREALAFELMKQAEVLLAEARRLRDTR